MDCLGRTEMGVFMEVFDNVGDLEEDSFMECKSCGKRVWNRGDALCKRCRRKISVRYEQLLELYTKQVLDSRSAVK